MTNIKIIYKTVPNFKTSTQVLRKKVVGIVYNNVKYNVTSDKREIFIDETNAFWYLIAGAVLPVRYAYVSYNGYRHQAITVDGRRLTFPSNASMKLVEEEFYSDNEGKKPLVLNVGTYYTLRNGIKVKLIAFENDLDFVSEPTYIGVYSRHGADSAIRFNANGQALSHGSVEEFNIQSIWTPTTLWLAAGFKNTVSGAIEPFSMPFKSEEAAKEYVGKHKNMVITKVMV